MQQNQKSFKGGMNLLVDDTRPTADLEGNVATSSYNININQYRIGFNTRCRYDVLESILSSAEDVHAPIGVKQGLVTFGDYLILFVAGNAYYKLFTDVAWTQIVAFSMSTTAPRYWTIAVPVAETYYARVGQMVSSTQANTNTTAQANAPINVVNVSGELQGNQPGLLVQDGINQPQFIYLDVNGYPQCSITQTYAQWDFQWISDLTSVNYGTVTLDKREYVPIGTSMEIYNGILFIVSLDGANIYRSVSGRPLDFVVNVDINGYKGGDATTTSYSIGVGSISCIKLVSGYLFVSAGNSCFSVTVNQTPNAPMIFGEYTFNRTFLFTASCISDRAIMDINGDTAFVDVNGIRSFNSILQSQNEGRNSVFSKTVSSLFTKIAQNNNIVAAVTYDNYALFAVNTTYGNVLIVYDTINSIYTSVDINQVKTTIGFKQLAAISTEVIALFGITADDKVMQLYVGPDTDVATVRFMSTCSQEPDKEIKQTMFRCVLSEFIEDSTVSLSTFVNNRLSGSPQTKDITYSPPVPVYDNEPYFSDANTQVANLLFTMPDCGQGWKSWNVLSWTGGGKITNIKTVTTDVTPIQPLLTQSNTK